MAPPNDDKPVVLFDGVCNLCNGWVKFVVRRDPAQRFRFASLQSAFAADVLAKHALPGGYLGSMLVLDKGVLYTQSDGVLRVLRGLPMPWPLLGALAIVPRPLRNVVYDWVARNRYRWFGKQESCMLPSASDALRFLS